MGESSGCGSGVQGKTPGPENEKHSGGSTAPAVHQDIADDRAHRASEDHAGDDKQNGLHQIFLNLANDGGRAANGVDTPALQKDIEKDQPGNQGKRKRYGRVVRAFRLVETTQEGQSRGHAHQRRQSHHRIQEEMAHRAAIRAGVAARIAANQPVMASAKEAAHQHHRHQKKHDTLRHLLAIWHHAVRSQSVPSDSR